MCICHPERARPKVSTKLRVNLFWLGKAAHDPRASATSSSSPPPPSRSPSTAIDACSGCQRTRRSTSNKDRIERHDVADLILRTRRPVAFDRSCRPRGHRALRDRRRLRHRRRRHRARSRARRARGAAHGAPAPRHRVGPRRHHAEHARRAKRPRAAHDHVHRRRRGRQTRHRAGPRVGAWSRPAITPIYWTAKTWFSASTPTSPSTTSTSWCAALAKSPISCSTPGCSSISTTNVIGLADHRQIETQIAPAPMFLVHVGTEAEGLPDGADVLVAPDAAPDDAVRSILAVLGDELG